MALNLPRPQLDSFRSPKGVLKAVNVILIIIALSTFSSYYNGWVIFVGYVITSGFIYGISLCAIYLFGDGQFQTTFYEPMMNSYFSLMFFITAIICWAKGSELHYSNGILIATGIFSFMCSIIFAVDCYFTLINSGTLDKLRGTPTTSNPQPVHQVNSEMQQCQYNSAQLPPVYTNPPVADVPSVYPTKTTVFPDSITNNAISQP